jgi:PAS domain S-box-containing protein
MGAIALMSGVRTLCPIDRGHTFEGNLRPEVRSSCVVVDNDQVVGILTERDVVRLIARQQPLDQLLVAEAMAQPVITRRQADLTDLFSTIDLLQQHHIHHLPIVDDHNRLVGLITHESLRQAFDLLECYTLTEVLEKKVTRLETERVALLEIRAAELERQVQERTHTLQVQAERDRLMAELSSQILASLDVQVILDTTVQQARQILSCDRVNIWRFEAGTAVVVAESTDADLSLVGERIGDAWFLETQAEVYRQGRIRVMPDIYAIEMADCHRDMLIRLQTRAKILVPLLCGDELWGLLNVTEAQPRDWQPAEIDFVRSLSIQLAIALNQASTYEQLQSELQERQQAERQLRQSTERLQEAQRIAHIGSWELDLQHNTLYWSEEVFRLFEIDPQQFGASYEAFLDLVHPDDRTLVNEAYASHLRDRQPCRLVHRLQMPGAQVKYVQEQWETIYSADGTPLISRGTVQDVTQQKVAELRRDRAESELRQVVEGTAAVIGEAFFPALVRHISEALGVRYVSIDQAMTDGFQVLAFFADGELSVPLFLPYDELPCCFKSLQTGSCCHSTGVQALYPGNALFTDLQVDSYLGVRLQNVAGDPIGNLCILHDAPLADPHWAQTLLSIFAARAGAELERFLTVQALETLNAELEARVTQRTTELAEREAILQDFLDNANDLIQMVDINTGRFEFVNRAWQNVLGYTPAEVAQLTFFDVLAPDCLPHCQAMLAQMRSGDITPVEQMELTFICKSGQRVVVEGNINCRFATEADGSQQPVSTRGIFRNVTTRKATEQELQRREARYRGLMEGAADAIVLVDLQGNILEANQKAEALLGYSLAELSTLHFTQLHLAEELPRVTAAFAEVAQGQRTQVLDVTCYRQDGSVVPVDITASVISINEEILVQGVLRDITDRKRYETALQESQQFLQTVLDTVPLSVFWKDRNSVYLGANQRFLQDAFLGSVSELVGTNDSAMPWGMTEAEAYRADDRIVMESGEAKLGIIELQHQQDGAVIWLETNKLPLRNLAGEVVGVLGTYQDITERKNAEIALQRQLAAIEAAVNGIAILENERYLYFNSSHAKMFGYEQAEELVGQSWRMLYSPEQLERFDREILPVLLAQKSWQGEVTATRKDGTTFPEQLSLTLSADNLIICVCQDISARKQSEDALQESEEKFRQLAEVVDAVFWILHLNRTDRVYVSPAYERIWGRPCTELYITPDAWLDRIHADDREQVLAAIPKQIEGTFDEEYRIIRPDGTHRWIHDRAFPIRNAQGQVYRLAGIAEDVTERKRSEDIIRQQAEREVVLREITQRIRESLNLQTIFDTACDEIRTYLRADRVGIFKFYPDSGYDGEFVAESVVNGFTSAMAIRIHDHCFGENYANLYAQGRYQVVDDIYRNGLTPCHTDVLAQFQVQANLVMPLLCNHELWGLLCIHQCDAPRHWQQSEIDLGQQLTNQLAIAIQQASLYEQVQTELLERQQAEATIARQLRQQTALELILQQIRQSLDLPEILAIATQQVQELLQGERVIVFQVCHDGQSHIVEEAVDPDLPRLKAMHWEDETWSQDILEHYWQGQPRIVPDVMDDIWTDCLVDYSQAGQIQSKIVAPILQELNAAEAHRWVSANGSNKLWGVLVVHACRSHRVWQPEEAQLLQQIANQLAIAIQQASLFEQLQQELTERQQAQAQLTRMNQELIRATHLKDEFLANMSHELRTPLNAILGMTEMLQEADVFGAINPQQLKALKTVERSGSHLLELINDVLDVAKIEAGQVELDLAPTAIAPLCQSSLAFVKQSALKKDIQLTVNLPADLPTILLDERRIRQVLINLLNNAVKFTPQEGQITLEVISLASSLGSKETPYLRFAVTDTGIGITPAEQQRLFQPFVQVDSALNRQYQGTGLGLALVKRIVELHGGQVGLTSEVGVGSCFTFDLPYAKGMATTPISSPAIPSSTVATTPATAPLILLAEDNEANISTIVSYLQAKGYRVDIAHNGQEAIDCLQHLTPDLILMDIQMPGMDGLEAIGHIRRDPRFNEVPIIALTSLAMPGDRDRCLAAGATEYLSKPVRLKQLVESIQTLILPDRHPSIPDN